MTMRIGRASLASNPKPGISLNGTTLTLPFEIVGTDANEMKALRQQIAGLEGNTDETEIPFTWSEDSTLDGIYRVSNVSIGSTANFLNNGFIPDCSMTLEQVPGFASPIYEVITQSTVLTNVHGATTPSCVVAYSNVSALADLDLRGTLAGVTQVSRPNDDGRSTVTALAYVLNSPLAPTQSRAFYPPAYFYYGAARVEVKYGSTWYQVMGRNIPYNSVWRISNANVRLTSANGGTSGTLEVWDNVAVSWGSPRNVTHWTNGAQGPHIGYGDGTNQAAVSILRNSPEQVTVRCTNLSNDFTYSIQRGNMFVLADWTCGTATKYGCGYSAATACTALTGGIRTTSNDTNGDRLVFSLPVAQTTDLVNGGTNASTAATSGRTMFGVALNGSSAAANNTEADLINQYLGAVSLRQRVVPR